MSNILAGHVTICLLPPKVFTFSPQSEHCFPGAGGGGSPGGSHLPSFLSLTVCTCLITIFPLWDRLSCLLHHMHPGDYPENEDTLSFHTYPTNSGRTCTQVLTVKSLDGLSEGLEGILLPCKHRSYSSPSCI